MQKFKGFLHKIISFLTQRWVSHKNRPDIIVKLPIHYRILDVLNMFAILTLLAYTIYVFPDLPESIPVHFTWDGSADDWQPKYFIFLEVFILIAIFGFLSYLSRFYIHYNYPVEITQENAESQYILALKFFTFLKTLNVILFVNIHWVMVDGAFDRAKASLTATFWILVAIICASTFIYKKIAQQLAKTKIISRPKTE